MNNQTLGLLYDVQSTLERLLDRTSLTELPLDSEEMKTMNIALTYAMRSLKRAISQGKS
jgi:hypothetical protein